MVGFWIKKSSYRKQIMNLPLKVVIYALSIFVLLPNSVLAISLDESKNTLSQVEEEVKNIEENLKSKRNEVSTLQGQLSYMDDQVAAVEYQINIYGNQIKSTNADIEATNNKILETQKTIENQQDILREYIIELYTYGNTTTLEMIAGSQSFSEYLNKAEYVETIQGKVNENLESIQKLKKELEEKKLALDQKKLGLAKLQEEQQIKIQVLDSQRQIQKSLVDRTKGQESEYKKQLSEAQTKQAEAFAQYQAAVKESIANSKSSYKGGSGNGYLAMPSNGVITQDYGCTSFAHNGIDIAYGYNGPIYAAQEGVVLDRGNESNSYGWGNWVAIEHPNGLVTLYGHLSSFAVNKGNTVTKGQIIGYEGFTGSSWPKGPGGSHLHFSVYTDFVLYDGAYHGPGYEGTANPYDFL